MSCDRAPPTTVPALPPPPAPRPECSGGRAASFHVEPPSTTTSRGSWPGIQKTHIRCEIVHKSIFWEEVRLAFIRFSKGTTALSPQRNFISATRLCLLSQATWCGHCPANLCLKHTLGMASPFPRRRNRTLADNAPQESVLKGKFDSPQDEVLYPSPPLQN